LILRVPGIYAGDRLPLERLARGTPALIDADDRHHHAMAELFEHDPSAWVLPWAILPEVDYLLATHVGEPAADAFRDDLASGAFAVEWGTDNDLARAQALCGQYQALRLGLVDAVVAAVAERAHRRLVADDVGPPLHDLPQQRVRRPQQS
jgi:predicted nucleic acid-binding protein